MGIKGSFSAVKQSISKYKYAVIVMIIGLALLLLPGKKSETVQEVSKSVPVAESINAGDLEKILQSIDGAGKVQVLLSIASGEETVYQKNNESSSDAGRNETKIETVITTDSNRSETGLITQINPPQYLGAIVVCEGADKAAVKYAVMQAVAKITGLGSDRICVLKMK